MGITRYAKIEQILNRLLGARRGNCCFPHEPPQDLRNLKIKKMRSM